MNAFKGLEYSDALKVLPRESGKSSSGLIIATAQFLTLTLFFGLIVFILIRMDSMRIGLHKVTEQNNKKSEHIYVMYTSARERVLALYRMLDMEDPFERDDLFLEYNSKGGLFSRARDELMRMELEPEEQVLLEEQGRLAKIIVPQLDSLIDKIQNDELDDARDILNNESISSQANLLSTLEELMVIQQQKTAAITRSTDAQFYENRLYTIIGSAAALLLGIFITAYMLRRVITYQRLIAKQAGKSSTILESISDGIIAMNADGMIEYMNEKASEFTNSSREITGGKSDIWSVFDFVRPEYLEVFKEMMKAPFNGILDMGLYEIKSSGKNKWIKVYHTQSYTKDMMLTSDVLVLSDVTEIKQSQLAMLEYNEKLEDKVYERTQELENTNIELKQNIESLGKAQEQLIQSEKMASLGGLVAGISHEINTPVGVSLTSATSMQESFGKLKNHFIGGTLTEEVFRKYTEHNEAGLNILIQNLNRASDLIRSFKQVAVDQSSGEFRTIALKGYTDEIITSLLPMLKRTDILIDNRINDSIEICTDPGAYYQIISNLITNSVTHAFPESYRAESGDANPQISIDAQASDKGLSIKYSDNGAGMSADSLNKLFDPFFTTRRGSGGSGLGMNIIYNIITTKFKGVVKADSAPNEGFVLDINLPLLVDAETGYEYTN